MAGCTNGSGFTLGIANKRLASQSLKMVLFSTLKYFSRQESQIHKENFFFISKSLLLRVFLTLKLFNFENF